MRNFMSLCLVCAFFLVSCAAAPTAANNSGGPGTPSYPAGIYVSMTGSDANSGTDKALPVLTIQVAIQKAVSSTLTSIYVAEGLYTNGFGLLAFTNSDESTNSGLFITNHNLSIYGGCDTNTFEPVSGHFSILSRGGKPDHVVEIKNATNIRLNGFIISGGFATTPDASSMPVGGGIFMTNANYCSVSNCLFTNNTGWHGAGMGLMHSRNNVISAYFFGNKGCAYGGGIALEAGANQNFLSVIILNHNGGGGIWINDGHTNVISGIIASNTNQHGGGIYLNWGNNNIFSNCVVSFNRTSGGNYGGGILIADQRNIIVDSFISNNFSEQFGGGAYISGANCAVSNSVFYNNTASNNTVNTYGGGLFTEGQNTVVYNSVFAGNLSIAVGGSIYAYGGGIHVATGSGIQIVNTLISNNSALYGGGIANLSGGANHLTVNSNIITCNQSSYMGGGFYAGSGSGSRVINNVITSNSAIVGCGMYMHGWAFVQSNLIATNKPVAWGSALFYSNYPTTNIHNVILGDNTAIGLDYCQIATTIFTSNIIGGSSTNNTGYAFYEWSADTYNHILTYNLFLINTVSYLYHDIDAYGGSNVTVGSDWTNINRTIYSGATTAAFNGVTNF